MYMSIDMALCLKLPLVPFIMNFFIPEFDLSFKETPESRDSRDSRLAPIETLA